MVASLRIRILTTLRIKVVRFQMVYMLTIERRPRSRFQIRQRKKKSESTRKRWRLTSSLIKIESRTRRVRSRQWYQYSSCLWRSWSMLSKMTLSQTCRKHLRSTTTLVSYSQTRFSFNLRRSLCSVKLFFFYRSTFTKQFWGSSSSFLSISLKSLSQFLTYSCLLYSILTPATMQKDTCLKNSL